MSHLHFWICLVIGSSAYHVGKYLMGFDPQWEILLTAIYWTAAALLPIHFGLINVRNNVK